MQPNLIEISSNIGHPILIKKWKVRKGMPVSFRQILFLYENADGSISDQQLLKFKSMEVGSVQQICFTEGATAKTGDVLLVLEECSHPTVMRDMCAECGADLRQSDSGVSRASVPMVHSIPELKVSEEQAHNLGKADEIRLLNDRKLVLLVDLDQTLVHTTNDNIPPNIKDVVHFQLYGPQSPWYHTKIRPGTEKFLKAASQRFELHICTFGARNYAHYIAMFLDPDGRFFSHRILSRDECFDANSKTANLKALFPCGDSMVCIIDDREDVWNYAPNLIHVKPYHFFQHTGDIHAPPGLAKTDNDLPDSGFNFSVMDEVEPREDEKKPPKSKAVASGETTTDKDTEDEAETKFSKTLKADLLSSEINNEPLPVKLSPISDQVASGSDSGTGQNAEDVAMETNETEVIEQVLEIEQNNTEILNKADPQEIESEVNAANDKMKVSDCKEANLSEGGDSLKSVESVSENRENGFVAENSGLVEEAKEEKDLIEVERENDSKGETVSTVKEECTIQENGAEPKEVSLRKEEPMEVENETKKDGDITEKEASESVKNNDIQNENSDNTRAIPQNDTNSKQVETVEAKKNSGDDLVEVEDLDDYLLHLEDILKKIHEEYYKEYDQSKQKGEGLPDLKKVIPNVKSLVLKGCELVFSGLVPSHVPLERSRAYLVAKSLGADVRVDLTPTTTHLVAARAGTAKVNASRRQKGVQVVTPDWLWMCAERWERIDERLCPLARGIVTSRHPPAHCSSPQPPPVGPQPERFIDTINPLLTLSSEEVARMDQEVADLCADSEESDSDDAPQRSPKPKINIKPRQTDEEEDSEDSLVGGHSPKGWTADGPKRKRKFDTTTCTESDLEEDSPSAKFRRGEPLPSDLDLGDADSDTQDNSFDDSQDDSAWALAGAALEREFLSSDK